MRWITSRAMAVTAVEHEHRVTPRELFFDLVFVFAFTQVATCWRMTRLSPGSAGGCSSSPRSGGHGRLTPGSRTSSIPRRTSSASPCSSRSSRCSSLLSSCRVCSAVTGCSSARLSSSSARSTQRCTRSPAAGTPTFSAPCSGWRLDAARRDPHSRRRLRGRSAGPGSGSAPSPARTSARR